jgi:hypothetical protein
MEKIQQNYGMMSGNQRLQKKKIFCDLKRKKMASDGKELKKLYIRTLDLLIN